MATETDGSVLDPATLDQWYCIQNLAEIPPSGLTTRLLGQDIFITGGAAAMARCGDRELPVRLR